MKKLTFLILCTGVLASCQRPDALPADPNDADLIQGTRIQNVQEITHLPTLNARMHWEHRMVDFEAQRRTEGEYYWEYVAQVDAPIFEGKELSATHVSIVDGVAVVGYNCYGDDHLGALEVINIDNRAFPEIQQLLLFDDADVNMVYPDPDGSATYRHVFAACSDRDKGASLRRFPLMMGSMDAENGFEVGLSENDQTISASANSIARCGGDLLVTTGKTVGGLVTVDPNSLAEKDHQAFTNGKYVDAPYTTGGDYLVLQTGDNAQLRHGTTGSSAEDSLALGAVIHQNVATPYRGKNTVHFADNDPHIGWVAAGQQGLLGYDMSTQSIAYTSAEDMLTAGNTNGIASDDDFLYMANGADALAVALRPESPGNVDPVFTWDMEDYPASANQVATDGEWIFIAKGRGGLVILRRIETGTYYSISGHDNQGVPEGYTEEPICNTLLSNFFTNVLPEGQNAVNSNPEYFDNTSYNLLINEPTELTCTFLHEGAGYKNVLGYYYYDLNDPPTSLEDLNRVIIFPNCSAQGSGGGLLPGYSMQLMGEFDAGTVVGFFVFSNGWNAGTQTIGEGYYQMYTNPEFNDYGSQQAIWFWDEACEDLVLAFEDIRQGNGDDDYNDAVFQVTPSNPNAVEVQAFIGI